LKSAEHNEVLPLNEENEAEQTSLMELIYKSRLQLIFPVFVGAEGSSAGFGIAASYWRGHRKVLAGCA